MSKIELFDLPPPHPKMCLFLFHLSSRESPLAPLPCHALNSFHRTIVSAFPVNTWTIWSLVTTSLPPAMLTATSHATTTLHVCSYRLLSAGFLPQPLSPVCCVQTLQLAWYLTNPPTSFCLIYKNVLNGQQVSTWPWTCHLHYLTFWHPFVSSPHSMLSGLFCCPLAFALSSAWTCFPDSHIQCYSLGHS